MINEEFHGKLIIDSIKIEFTYIIIDEYLLAQQALL